MLGIGWGEMFVIAVVVLIVVGPKDLPVMLRNLGKMTGALRRMSNEFRREIDKAVALEEVREAQKAISDPLKQTSAEIAREFNAMRDGKAVPSGKIKPAEPGKESVVAEIRQQAGMPPLQAPTPPPPAKAAPSPAKPAAKTSAKRGKSAAAASKAAPSKPAAPKAASQKPAAPKTAAQKPAKAPARQTAPAKAGPVRARR